MSPIVCILLTGIYLIIKVHALRISSAS